MSNQNAPKNIRGSRLSKICIVGVLVCILTLFGGCKPKEPIRTYDPAEVVSEESATIPTETPEEVAEETETTEETEEVKEEIKEETKIEEKEIWGGVEITEDGKIVIKAGLREPQLSELIPFPEPYDGPIILNKSILKPAYDLEPGILSVQTVPQPTDLVPVPILGGTFFTKPNDAVSYTEKTERRFVDFEIGNGKGLPCLITLENIDTKELIIYFQEQYYEGGHLYEGHPLYDGRYPRVPYYIEPGVYNIYMESGIIWYGLKDRFGEDNYCTVIYNYRVAPDKSEYYEGYHQNFSYFRLFEEGWEYLFTDDNYFIEWMYEKELPYIDLIK